MVRVNINEPFPLTVTLIDEETGIVASNKTVSYDIRKQPGDDVLSPELSGNLIESTVEPGIYKIMLFIEEPGVYIAYISCPGFLSNTEEIIVDNESIINIIKQNRHYNISVEDVIRENDTPTSSQSIRKVPKGRTDYVVTRIKRDKDIDWSGDHVVEGRVYAWYRNDRDKAPYRMSSET